MKINTLHKLAREISKEHRVTVSFTANEMTEKIKFVTRGCRSKAQAKAAIAKEIFQISAE